MKPSVFLLPMALYSLDAFFLTIVGNWLDFRKKRQLCIRLKIVIFTLSFLAFEKRSFENEFGAQSSFYLRIPVIFIALCYLTNLRGA